MKELSAAELEKRTDFLNKEVKFNGWGDLHRNTIFNELQKGNDKFSIDHLDKIRLTDFVSTLKFEESNIKTTAYMQFKGFEMTAPGPDGNLFNQSFKYMPYQTHTNEDGSKTRVNAPLTKTAAFNVMSGGSYLETFTKKDPATDKISVYKAYYALDFRYEDKKGDTYSLKELNPAQLADGSLKLIHQEHLNLIKLTDFGLQQKITHLPIADLSSKQADYVEQLNRGYTIQVHMNVGGQKVPQYLKADPWNGTIAQFNEKMERIDLVKTKEQKLDTSTPKIQQQAQGGVPEKNKDHNPKLLTSKKKEVKSQKSAEHKRTSRKGQGV